MANNIERPDQEGKQIEDYMTYSEEELRWLLENPGEIETGCELPTHIEDAQNYELGLIKETLRRKDLQSEHIREFGNTF